MDTKKDTWDKITTGLDEEKDRPVAIFWLRWGGILLITLITGGLLWTLLNSKSINVPEETITNSSIVEQNDATETFEESTFNPISSNTTKHIKNEKHSITTTNDDSADNSKNTSSSETNIYNTSKKTNQNQVTSSFTIADDKKNNSNNTIENYSIPQKNRSQSISEPATTHSNDNRVTYNSNTTLTGLFTLDQEDRNYYSKKQAIEKELRSLYNEKVQEELDQVIKQQQAEATAAYIAQEKEQQFTEAITSADTTGAETSNNINTDLASSTLTKAPKLPKTEEERRLDREASIKYKWGVSPYLSSIRYGFLTRGTSVDNSIEGNSGEGINTFGYGLKLDVPISKRSRIKFGIGLTPLRFRNNNFQVNITNNNTINIFQLAGISPRFFSESGIVTTPEALDFFINNEVASIVQDISYLEFPINYQYLILNKRIGIGINSGISLLALRNNSISAVSNTGQSLNVGEDTNLRDFSISLNFGLEAYYNLSSEWRFDIAPVFTSFLNPNTSNLGNFRPFYLGLQFGTTYKF